LLADVTDPYTDLRIAERMLRLAVAVIGCRWEAEGVFPRRSRAVRGRAAITRIQASVLRARAARLRKAFAETRAESDRLMRELSRS
jgi:hypothetical protein